LVDGGFGYTVPPTVTIYSHVPGTGSDATAIATIANGFVTGFVVTNSGTGYSHDNTPSSAIAAPVDIEVEVTGTGSTHMDIYLGTGKRSIEE